MRIKTIAAVIVTVCLLMISVGGVTVCAAEGATFQAERGYVTKEVLASFPKTIEATLCFPSDHPLDKRGGVVFGNYYGSGSACVNFEIHQNGSPRIYYIDNEGKSHDQIFERVNVCTGDWVHVAVVTDTEAGTAACYVNGELKQTLKAPVPSEITFRQRAVIGGDMRPDNGQYFKGKLRNVAIYNDMRTADEIAADATATTPDTDALFGFYEPDGTAETLKDSCGNGPEFLLVSRESFMKNYSSVTDYDYSFAVIGDIQTLTCYYPEELHNIYDWLVDNAKAKKLEFVVGLGDITDKDTDSEWELAKTEMAKLNGVVPYSFVRGNHDSTGQYKNYFSYEEYKDTVDGCFKETMLNTYHTIRVKGRKYLFLNLDLSATDNMLAWANEVVEQHKDHTVIITTHIYLSAAGTLFNDSSASSLTRYGMQNYPDVIWDKLVSRHENISMVLCGHAPTDRIVVNRREGVHGNTVTEMLIDPQTTDKTHEAVGMVAMLHFSNGGKTVDVEYYSTVKEGHFLEENQFRLEVDVPQSTAVSPWWLLLLLVPAAAVVIVLVKKKQPKNEE